MQTAERMDASILPSGPQSSKSGDKTVTPKEVIANITPPAAFVGLEAADAATTIAGFSHTFPNGEKWYETTNYWAEAQHHFGVVPGTMLAALVDIAAIAGASQVTRFVYNRLPEKMRSRTLEWAFVNAPYITMVAAEAATVVSNLWVLAGFGHMFIPNPFS